MTDEEILILFAKDVLVKKYKFNVLVWSSKTWFDAIFALIETFDDKILTNARLIYGEEY